MISYTSVHDITWKLEVVELGYEHDEVHAFFSGSFDVVVGVLCIRIVIRGSGLVDERSSVAEL